MTNSSPDSTSMVRERSPQLAQHDPRALLLLYISVSAWLVIGSSVWFVSTAAIVLGLTAMIAGVAIRQTLRVLLFLVPFTALVTVFNGLLLTPGPQDQILIVVFDHAIGLDSVVAGLSFGIRMIGLVWAAMLLLTICSTERYAAGIARLLLPLRVVKLPVAGLYYLVFFAMRSIPVLHEESQWVRRAQRSRGITFRGSLISRVRSARAIVVPSFAAAVRRSERLALSLAARGFDPTALRAEVTGLKFQARDWLVTGLIAAGWVGFTILS